MANDIGKFLKGFDITKAKTIIIIAVVIFVIYVLVEFGGDFEQAISSILVGLGLKKSAVQSAAESTIQQTSANSTNPTSPWSPNLYNSNPDASTLDYTTLQGIANDIYNTVSWLPNWLDAPDASTALGDFKQLNNKIDVSNLVIVFQQLTGQDLYTFLEMNYTSSANEVILQQIINFVNSLPNA